MTLASPAQHNLSLSAKDWTVAYDGHGSVTFTGGQIRLAPHTAAAPDQTHAALVLSRLKNLKYFEVDITYINVRQLRTPNDRTPATSSQTANAWEVFWLFFNYRPNVLKSTNYVTVKTNGVEIGRASGDRDQTILKTWAAPVATLGVSQRLRVQRLGTKITVQVGDESPLIYDFSLDKEKPFVDAGQLGLYCEDAEVIIEKIELRGR